MTISLASLNIFISVSLFLRYFGFRKNRIPGLHYCLALVFLGLVHGVVSLVAFLLPYGAAFLFCVDLMMCATGWVNTMFMLLVGVLTSKKQNDMLLRMRWVFFVLLGLGTVMFLTNSWHHLLVVDAPKAADGFLYDIQLGKLYAPFWLYAFGLSVVAAVRIFRSGATGVIRTPSIRWLFVLVACTPSILSGLEQVVPLLHTLRISVVFSWVPYTTVSYLFFGYLLTARRMAIDVMRDAFVLFDLRGFCVDINTKGEEFFEKYAGTRRPTAAQFETLVGTPALVGPAAENEVEILAPGGGATYYTVGKVRISNGLNQDCGNGVIIQEVTEYRRRMDQLSSMATEDPLTGAKNRRYLAENADELLARAAQDGLSVAALMIDLDFFKRVNDVYGHLAGDEVLAEAYRIFERTVRSEDVVYRYGGEEFLVLSVGIAHTDALRMAERIRAAVQNASFATAEGEVDITVSIGVYTCVPAVGDDIDRLVEQADKALYQAKADGRNRVVVAQAP
ncbi:diguanylate cyclase [Ruminococcaceae bacterium OttesenSCG-928-O06]|nr:diguanylate cyclase [Ruminococcaceae bacterium OttesenSCG-928-O06]